MLIQITEKLVSLAEKKNPLQEKAKETLELLDISNRLGKHFVFVTHPSLFIRIREIGIKVDSLVNLEASYTYDKQIIRTFEWHVEIDDSPRSSKDEKTGTIVISLNDIPPFQLYTETTVIGENLSDVTFFKYILSHYKHKNGLETVDTFFHGVLGGGSTTCTVFEYEQSLKQSFIVCVSDSDYAFPGSSLGDTASNISKVFQTKPSFNSHYYHFSAVSEVENLVPKTIYQKYCYETSGEMKSKFDSIEQLSRANPICFHYLDIKEGLTLHSISKYSNKKYFFDWLRPIIPDIENDYGGKIAVIETHIPVYSAEDKKKKMKGNKYVEGLGGKILDNILRYCDRNSFVTAMENDATTIQQKEYETIGKILYNWCCTRKKIRL